MAGVPEGLRLRPVKTKHADDAAGNDDGSDEKKGSDSADDVDPPVSPTGRLFLHDDFYTTILCALEFQNKMELEDLRAVLSDTLVHHPRFHSRVVCLMEPPCLICRPRKHFHAYFKLLPSRMLPTSSDPAGHCGLSFS